MTNLTPAVLFQNLLNSFGTDALTDGEGLLANFFAAVEASPSIETVVTQAAVLAASAPLQLPHLEGQAIGQTATTGKALLALLPSSVSITIPTP